MTDDEINAMVRRLALTQNPAIISDDMLTVAKAEAIKILGEVVFSASPESFEKKISISADYSGTPVFSLPSDNAGVKAIWDYKGSVGAISGAADNGSGAIRLTHDLTLEDENRVIVHDVTGCTEANGTWQVDYVDSTHVDLVGSTFTNAYVSGGKIFKDSSEAYQYPITRRPSKYQAGDSELHFFLQGSDILIDDPEFENDIIMLYRYRPSTLTEIPAHIHSGIYAFATIMLAKLPEQGSELFSIIKKNLDLCMKLWEAAQQNARSYAPILETSSISNVKSIKKWL